MRILVECLNMCRVHFGVVLVLAGFCRIHYGFGFLDLLGHPVMAHFCTPRSILTHSQNLSSFVN